MTTEERIKKFKVFMGDKCTQEMLDWLIERGFFTAPASTKYHGNYEGGLFDHSYTVASVLVQLTYDNHLLWMDTRSPYIVGMFHDLCKIDNYRLDTNTAYVTGEVPQYEYNNDTLLKGHGDKSVMLLSQFYKLTMEEILAIRYHMGAFTDKEEWRDYTRAVHEYPNTLWTHQADMIASHGMGV